MGGYAISCQNNLKLHLGCHTCGSSYFTLVYLWCGRTVIRCTVTWLPDFLGWVDLLTHGAMLRSWALTFRQSKLNNWNFEVLKNFIIGENWCESYLTRTMQNIKTLPDPCNNKRCWKQEMGGGGGKKSFSKVQKKCVNATPLSPPPPRQIDTAS